jgi:hypothetical protein
MNGLLMMTWREIHARRMVFVAAAFAGILPFLAPLLPGVRASNPSEIRGIFALILALSFGFGAAILLGSTVIVRDLAEQRLGFYFTRPLSALHIWGGKLLAATLIVVGTLALCAVPTLLFDGGFGKLFHLPLEGLGPALRLGIGSFLVVLLLAHAFSSAIRSHSRWLVVDVVMAVVVGTVIWWAMRSLLLSGTWGFGESEFNIPDPTWALVALCLALLIASYVQVSVGRTDPIRAHRALSKTFWGISGAVALLLTALAVWVGSATPASITTVRGGVPAPQGDWALVEGSLRHRGGARGLFLWNHVSGKSLKVPLTTSWVVFSGDGTHAAWLESLESSFNPGGTHELVTVDLGANRLEPVTSKITFPGWTRCQLSPSGRRVAAIDQGILTVYDLASGKSIAGARLPEAEKVGPLSLLFTGEDHVRVFRAFTYAKSVAWPYLLELDVPGRKLATTGRVEAESSPHVLSIVQSRSGDRLLVADGNRRSLRDGRTGSLVAQLGEGQRSMGMEFIAGGGVVAVSIDGGRASLDMYSPAGAWEKRIPLGPAEFVPLSGQLEDGRILAFLLTSRNPEERWKNADLIAIDLSTGRVSSLSRGLRPFVGIWWLDSGPVFPSAGPGTKLFLDRDDALVRLDTKEGTRVVLGGTH